MNISCPCCTSTDVVVFKRIENFNYYQCVFCKSIFLDNSYLIKIDEGYNLVKYKDDYWENELKSSKERSYGAAIARMAEAFYYCRIPIYKFIDIATGPGYFLDAVKKYLPNSAEKFYGVEKFPPKIEFRTTSSNYIIGDIDDLDYKFDAGICIEVIEHLTPFMFNELLRKLAAVSNEQALYIFNSGLPEYVINEDPNYLDPVERGHIMCYSLVAVDIFAKKHGFTLYNLPGKTWAFALEFMSKSDKNENIQDRIWTALPENLDSLTDKDMGSVIRILGLETSRAYR